MLSSYAFKSQPFAHQREALEISCDRTEYALLMEQGTGKSKPIVDNAAMLYLAGKIDCLIIVAPNGVHRKWLREDVPLSLPNTIKYKCATWQASSVKAERAVEALYEPGPYLRIFAINVEAFSGDATKKSKRLPKGVVQLRRMLQTFNCFLAIDESSYIKSHNSSRTENIIDLGQDASYRRIASGTAAPESPLDLFAQFKFLNKSILGSNFFSFKAQYSELLPADSHLVQSIMRKNPNMRMAPQLVATDETTGRPRYKNVDKLKLLIAPHAYRKLKMECFDLPEKLYRRRYFEMEKNQERMYRELKAKQKAEFNSNITTVIQKVVLLMRLSQLVRGYMLDHNDQLVRLFEPAKNPAIIEMLTALEEMDTQCIIWCRFKHEIVDVLTVLGAQAVPYYGETKNDEREANLAAFKQGHAKYLVGTVDAGGIGLNMYESPYTFFYSNQFSSGKRQQAEDRNHRWGSVGVEVTGETGLKVLYEDLVCPDTVDEHVLAALMNKKEMSEYIMDFDVVYNEVKK
jgi:hypothetical protein